MAALNDFSHDQIRQIHSAVGLVITGAAMSEPGGALSMAREAIGGMKAVTEFLQAAEQPLLVEIMKDLGEPESDQRAAIDRDDPAARQQAMDTGIEAAVDAHSLLVEKAAEEEARDFARLLLAAADATVRAAKSGGILGIGGKQVTASEAAYVRRLADALGYSWPI
jgi:tagatose-1,6-bisphosphate aldolase non-catalytic subunit AgaZ/GatZ